MGSCADFSCLVVSSFYNSLIMQEFIIEPLATDLDDAIAQKIDLKTKPQGALGRLEKVAAQICRIQQTLEPQLKLPSFFVCAADHGVVAEGVSPYPQDVTWQMVYNFLSGGAAINVFARQHGIALKVVDCGVKHDFAPHSDLIAMKIDYGTKNMATDPAMSVEQCKQALGNGAKLVDGVHASGSNVIGLGEMGIGNTTAASALLCKLAEVDPAKATGAGTGLSLDGILHKQQVIARALDTHLHLTSPIEILAALGGFEIITMAGAILQAAHHRMVVLIDGFIATSALLAAHALHPDVLDYCISCHQSNENAHRLMLEILGVEPLMKLDMRLGEGTGAAVAYPLILSAVNFVNEMSSFEGAGVSQQ